MTSLQPWSVTAVNLPEHAGNAIHTDVGARDAGFAGALVAGVTTYAYLSRAPIVAWGIEWLATGGAEVRFRHPVMDHDRIELEIGDDELVTATVAGDVKASASFVERGEPMVDRPGAVLDPIGFVVDSSWSDYGHRAGDDAAIYAERAVAHATSWPRIANQFCHEQLVTDSWIHVRSRITHHGLAAVGSEIHARATVVDRFDSRAGERAVLDVRISADGSPVASVEHEAIITLHA